MWEQESCGPIARRSESRTNGVASCLNSNFDELSPTTEKPVRPPRAICLVGTRWTPCHLDSGPFPCAYDWQPSFSPEASERVASNPKPNRWQQRSLYQLPSFCPNLQATQLPMGNPPRRHFMFPQLPGAVRRYDQQQDLEQHDGSQLSQPQRLSEMPQIISHTKWHIQKTYYIYSTHGFINFTIYMLNFRHIRHSCFLFKGLLDKEASFLCFTWIVGPSHTCSDTLRDSLRDGNSFEGWVLKQDLVNQLSGSISSEDTEFFYVYIHTVYAEYVYIYSVCVNTWTNMSLYSCNSCVWTS